MKRTYITGMDTNEIVFSLEVGTAGIVHSLAHICRTGGVRTKIGESDLNSGAIATKTLGKAAELKGSYLVILTTVDIGALDKSLQEQLIRTLSIRYHLQGGFSGIQVFGYDPDDVIVAQGGKLIIVTKPIELQ